MTNNNEQQQPQWGQQFSLESTYSSNGTPPSGEGETGAPGAGAGQPKEPGQNQPDSGAKGSVPGSGSGSGDGASGNGNEPGSSTTDAAQNGQGNDGEDSALYLAIVGLLSASVDEHGPLQPGTGQKPESTGALSEGEPPDNAGTAPTTAPLTATEPDGEPEQEPEQAKERSVMVSFRMKEADYEAFARGLGKHMTVSDAIRQALQAQTPGVNEDGTNATL